MRQGKFWAMAAILLAAVTLSLCVGRYPISLRDLWEIALRQSDGMGARVFLQIRLPRTFLVLACGAALSVSGLIYQHMFRNPLVSPDVLGVTGGASVGAAAAILFGSGAAGIAAAAFGGGILTVAATVLLAGAMGGERRLSLLISGIVTGAAAESFLMVMKYAADPAEQLPAIDFWLMGGFHTADWQDVWIVVPAAALSLAGLWLLRWKLEILSLGEEEAKSLGVPAEAVRLGGIVFATLLAAVVVSAAGAVSWVGLIVPHLIRRIFGEELKENLFPCALGGGAFLLAADLIARSVTAAEIPISILTSLTGAAVLAAVLAGKGRRGESL